MQGYYADYSVTGYMTIAVTLLKHYFFIYMHAFNLFYRLLAAVALVIHLVVLTSNLSHCSLSIPCSKTQITLSAENCIQQLLI
jgi:hypothetical protein